MKESTLNKHKKVIDQYYLNGFNGVQAYMSIYPNSSYNAADTSFREILENPRIQSYIEQKEKQAQEKTGYSHNKLLETLKSWLEADITETLNISAKELKELPKELRIMITEVSSNVTRKGEDKIQEQIKLKFVSKEKAAEMIARHIGFYKEDNEQKTPKRMTESEIDAELERLRNDEL